MPVVLSTLPSIPFFNFSLVSGFYVFLLRSDLNAYPRTSSLTFDASLKRMVRIRNPVANTARLIITSLPVGAYSVTWWRGDGKLVPGAIHLWLAFSDEIRDASRHPSYDPQSTLQFFLGRHL
ncbi:MAG: hypothetical protein U9N77_10955 [Thermodesulfobacteriota bacterium]|nr:hypothetical protein [Thermodesulfobacteriota bacterium]